MITIKELRSETEVLECIETARALPEWFNEAGLRLLSGI